MERKRTPGSPFLDAELFAPSRNEDLITAAFDTDPLAETYESGEAKAAQRVRTFRVVDAAEAKLASASYEVHQDGKTDTGTLNAAGEGRFAQIDPGRPVRLHVDGRVCAIVEGAVLVHDDPAVEYGGQFVDWRLGDAAGADVTFWRPYRDERKADASGPMRFWQHDHIMRRPVRLRSAYASGGKVPVFQAKPLTIRVGPLVRFTNESCALVWLELETPGLVRVRYRKADEQVAVPRPGKALRELDMKSRHAATVRVGGRHFALVPVDGLSPDTLYQYTIELAPLPAVGAIPQTDAQIAAAFPVLSQTVRDSLTRQLSGASFRKDAWLFFRTLRLDYEQLRFAHGSCRKYPGDSAADGTEPGPDMLAVFGTDWLAKQQRLDEWPRFFLHTGDQIYADQIGRRQAERIAQHRFASIVPGPRTSGGPEDGAWAGRFADRYVAIDPRTAARMAVPAQKLRDRIKQLEPLIAQATKDGRVDAETIRWNREREDARKALGQQAAFQRADSFVDPKRPMRFRQRIQNWLLWSIPYEKSDSPEVAATGLRRRDAQRSYHPSAGDDGGMHAADFAEFAYLHERAWSVEGARKALAHLPSFMIFDDHEITDDWNFSAKWVDIVHGNAHDPYELWPKTITDGLAAYWMYQGWGNLPPQAWATDPRVQILERARASGKDALPELRQLILARAGRPARPGTDASKRLTWHYALPVRLPRFFVVDDRTEREVYGAGGPFQSQLRWLEAGLRAAPSSAAFIVFPTPFLLPHPLSWAMAHPEFTRNIEFLYKIFTDRRLELKTVERLKRDADMEHAAGNQVWDQMLRMLARIQDAVTPLKTIAFLSGDVHFSCSLDGQLEKLDSPLQPNLLQLVSSGLRAALNAAKKDQLRRGYSWFGFDLTGGHRGLKVRLGGLDGPGRDDPNFLFPTSVALVDVDLRRKTIDARLGHELPNVAIRQRNLVQRSGVIEAYDFHYSNNEATGPRLLTPGRTN
jgi:hypothetical protein